MSTPAPRATVLRQFYRALESCGFCARHDTISPSDLLWVGDQGVDVWTRTVLGQQLGPRADAALEMQMRVTSEDRRIILLTSEADTWQLSSYWLDVKSNILRATWEPDGPPTTLVVPVASFDFFVRVLRRLLGPDVEATEDDIDADAEEAVDACTDRPIPTTPPVPYDPDQALASAAWHGCCALARELYGDVWFRQVRPATPMYSADGRPFDFWFGRTIYTIYRPEQPLPFSMGCHVLPDGAPAAHNILHSGSLPEVWRALQTVKADRNRD